MMTTEALGLAEPKKIDYWFQEDENWTIEDWSGLSKAFEITATDLESWHESVYGQGRHWEIARLRFGVSLMVSTEKGNLRYQRARTIEETAKEIKMKVSEVTKELEALVEFWKRIRSTKKSASTIKAAAKETGLEEIDHYLHSDLNPDQVENILKGLHLTRLSDDALKIHIASRALELQSHLQQKSSRALARNILQKEVSAWHQERMLDTAGNALTRIDQNPNLSDDQKFKKILEIQTEIKSIEKHLTSLQKEIRETTTEIGADQMDESEAKRSFTGALSEITVRMKEYYENPENILMDGIFTAEEILWLTEAKEFRDAQYRPDFVVMMNHALRPENLWNPDYQEQGAGREATRRLLKIVQEMGKEILPVNEEEPEKKLPAAIPNPEPENLPEKDSPDRAAPPVNPNRTNSETDSDFIC